MPTRCNHSQFFAPKSRAFRGARRPIARIFALILRTVRARSLQNLQKACASVDAKAYRHRQRRRRTRGATSPKFCVKIARFSAERARFFHLFCAPRACVRPKICKNMREFQRTSCVSSAATALHTRRNLAQFFAPKSRAFRGARRLIARIFALILRAVRARSLQNLQKP